MIIFENPGVLDLKAITTFGVSVKTTENPIGFFGTGSKYAVAILLRNGFSLKLITGGKEYKFSIKNQDFRGKEFGVIQMNDSDLPFTTHLGANWESWMAFRELHCNASDEGGDSYCTDSEPNYDDDRTYFVLDGPEANSLFEKKNEIILSEENRTSLKFVEIVNKPSSFLYYRGIRVLKLPKQSLYTYNITGSLSLTEDRTVSGDWQINSYIANSIFACSDKNLIKTFIAPNVECFEKTIGLSAVKYSTDLTKEFLDCVSDEYDKNNDNLNPSLKEWISDVSLNHRFKKIKIFNLDSDQKEMLKISLMVVKRMFPSADYEIIFSESLGQRTKAFADKIESKIYLSRDCFEEGQLFLTSTILEEFVHLEKGLDDETRELQTFLFDNLTKRIAKEVGILI